MLAIKAKHIPTSLSLLVFGAGGHGRVVADAALLEGRWIAVFASDRDPLRCVGELLPGIALIPGPAPTQPGWLTHVAIGSNHSREREAGLVGLDFLARIIHPDAVVSKFSHVATGCFVGAGAVVAPGANVGVGVVVNHGAIVDHDVHVGAFSHIAPNATLGGGASLGQRVLIGAGAVVLPGIVIGDDVTVGAGSAVPDHLPAPGTYAGVPARRIK